MLFYIIMMEHEFHSQCAYWAVLFAGVTSSIFLPIFLILSVLPNPREAPIVALSTFEAGLWQLLNDCIIGKTLHCRTCKCLFNPGQLATLGWKISCVFHLCFSGMAFALLANLPPINGLYSSFFPLITYFLLGGVHQMVPGKISVPLQWQHQTCI